MRRLSVGMIADESEHRVSWRELAAAAVIGCLAGYGAVALAYHFVLGYRMTVGAMPSRPCGLGIQPQARPLAAAAGHKAPQQLQRSADVYTLSRKGALVMSRAAHRSRMLRYDVM